MCMESIEEDICLGSKPQYPECTAPFLQRFICVHQKHTAPVSMCALPMKSVHFLKDVVFTVRGGDQQ